MWHLYYWVLLAGLAWFVLFLLIRPFMHFVVLPIRMHHKSKVDPGRGFEPADLQKMSPEARQQFEIMTQQFREEGFEPIGPPLTHSNIASVSAVQSLLVNPAGDIVEIVSTASQRHAFLRNQMFYIRSKFSDDTEVVTCSTKRVGIFPENPLIDLVNFRWIKDAHTACEAHRRRMHRLGFSNRARIAPKAGEHEAFEKEEGWKEMERMAKLRYFWFNRKARVYHETWKGSFLMGWRLSWPLKNLGLRASEQKAHQVWRELGMDQWRLAVSAASAGDESIAPSALVNMEYEPQLKEGEVHTHEANGALTVRIGMESRGQFLERQWLQYLTIILLAAVIAMNWYFRWLYGRGRPMPLRGAFMYYMWWFLLLLTIVELIIGAIRRRGTAVLVASHRGLNYRNIRTLRGAGEIARENIRSLSVLIYGFGLGGRKYQLYMQAEIGPHRVLAVLKDKKELERVRDLLSEAMGVKSAQASAVPA